MPREELEARREDVPAKDGVRVPVHGGERQKVVGGFDARRERDAFLLLGSHMC